ncbi:substrate-binding periplasmic protein [Pseudoalteromonas atlantica]|uniref:substrate-binding periplasmic protein n=1 Tax=Pseudoalteromonas atlantica TaxID=288 RepID=UPI0037361981
MPIIGDYQWSSEKIIRNIFVLLCCLNFSAIGYAKPLITIYTEHFPPYNFSNKGQLQGINLDITRALCKRVNVDCQFELLPWTRAYHLAQKNKASGLVSTARSSERESLFQWVGPLASSRTFFYRLASNDHINPTELSQLSTYTLGLARGDVYAQLVHDIGFVKDKNLLNFAHHYEYINLFFKNKIDLILGSESLLDYQLQQYGHNSADVVKLIELPVGKLKGNYLAFNKSVPKEIVDKFNHELAALKETDDLEQFRLPYLKKHD